MLTGRSDTACERIAGLDLVRGAFQPGAPGQVGFYFKPKEVCGEDCGRERKATGMFCFEMVLRVKWVKLVLMRSLADSRLPPCFKERGGVTHSPVRFYAPSSLCRLLAACQDTLATRKKLPPNMASISFRV